MKQHSHQELLLSENEWVGCDPWLTLMLLLTHLAVLSTLWSEMKAATLSSSTLTQRVMNAHLSSFCTLGLLILFCLPSRHAGGSDSYFKQAWLETAQGTISRSALGKHMVHVWVCLTVASCYMLYICSLCEG